MHSPLAFNKIFHLLLHLDRSSLGMCSPPLLCPGSYSPIHTASDYSLHQDQNFPVTVSLWNCHKFAPNLRAIQPRSSHHPIHHNSSHHRNKWCPCKNCQSDTSVQIPEFMNLSLISGVQDWINQFSRFHPYTGLCHLWNLGIFLWIFRLPYLPYSFLGQHSWAMTCAVCLWRTIACHCLCVGLREHCSLSESERYRN